MTKDDWKRLDELYSVSQMDLTILEIQEREAYLKRPERLTNTRRTGTARVSASFVVVMEIRNENKQ